MAVRSKGTVEGRQIKVQNSIPRFGVSRRKECPLFNGAGVYSGGRLRWVGPDSRSKLVAG